METTTNNDIKSGDLRGASVQTSVLHSSRIHGSLALVLVLLAAFLFAQTINALKEYRYIGGGIAPSNAISVSGTGEVFAVPDTAEFTFTIRKEAATAGEVQQAATEQANTVLAALKEQGVEEKDVKTVAYDLHPQYEWQPLTCVRYPCDRKQVQKGFELLQSMQIKTNNLDKAGELISLVSSKEVSSVSGLTFTIADEDVVRAEARALAITEAKAKADKLATALGVSLTRIVGFYEDGGERPMYATTKVAYGLGGADMAEEAAPAPLPAGENQIISNVTITYELR